MKVTETTSSDVGYISRNLREADRQEVFAATGRSPEVVMPLSFHASSKARTLWTRDGEPFAVMAIANISLPHEITQTGAPWMLATDRIEDEWLPFLRRCNGIIDELAEGYHILENFTYTENTLYKKWLAYWCKFELSEAVPWGPFGAPFNKFTKRNYSTCALTQQRLLPSARQQSES